MNKNLLTTIHESWYPIQDYLLIDPKLIHLNTQVLPMASYRPAQEDIFKCFRMSLHDIRVVVLGQDPYFNRDATGLAYQMQGLKDSKVLKAIYQELKMEGFENPNIDTWEKQGVFLLNTALTVKAGKPNSHTQYWKNFISRVISYISHAQPTIWLLWGKRAKSFLPYIHRENNVVMIAPYPASEMYKKSVDGFYGCGHFKAVNDILSDNPIIW